MAEGPPEPTMAQLRALAAVADAGGYAAAETAGLASRQLIWQRIHRLEQMTIATGREVQLVRPGGGELTRAGWEVLAAARSAIAAMESVREALRSVATSPEGFVIGCYPSHAVAVISASQSEGRGPSFELRLAPLDDDARSDGGNRLVVAVQAGLTDMAIVPDTAAAQVPDLIVGKLYEWRLVAVAANGHTFVGRTIIEIDELANERLLTSPPGHVSSQRLRSSLPAHLPVLTSPSVDALVALACANFGIAVVPGDSLPLRRTDGSPQGSWPIICVDGVPLDGVYYLLARPTLDADIGVAALRALRRSLSDAGLLGSIGEWVNLPKP